MKNIDTNNIKDILIAGNYISEEDVQKAEDVAKKNSITFIDALLRDGIVNSDIVGQATAESFKVPYADLNSAAIGADQVRKIPEETAKKLRTILFDDTNEKEVTITTDNPLQDDLEKELQTLFADKKIKITYSLPEDIDSFFIFYEKPLDTRFSKIIEESDRVAPEILEEIFDDALTYKASDVHFEPQARVIVIRFRVDGVLHEAGRLPKEYYENVLNRIKVKSALRIDEHYAAQDGALHYEGKNGISVDMRTSIIPIVEGEKVVLRILGSYVQGLTFNDLGLTPRNQE